MPIAVVVPVSAQADDELLDAPFCSGSIQWRRTVGEVRAEWGRLEAKVAAVMPADLGAMNDLHRGFLGMWAAAAWTIGATALAPMTEALTPLEMPALIRESELALELSADGDLPSWAYAEGVTRWLGWIVGGVDRVRFPGEL